MFHLKPTDWVNGLVVVEKQNGKLRVCLDPRPLNKVIKREHLHLPTAEEIFSQIKFEKQSSILLTFGTPSGRYSFKRLPHGIHSASEVFQRQVTSIISDKPGSANSQDDFIVWGKTLQEHGEHLRKDKRKWFEAK